MSSNYSSKLQQELQLQQLSEQQEVLQSLDLAVALKSKAKIHKRQPIAVLGAGSWGTALAMLLAKNGQDVRLWGHDSAHIRQMQITRYNQRYLDHIPFPDKLQLVDDLSVVLQGVQDILLVVPSHAFTEILLQIKPFLHEESRLVWGTKGLEPRTGNLFHVVTETILDHHYPQAVLAGPSFAKEVALAKPTAVTLATKDITFAKTLSYIFNNPNFRVYTTTDVAGVEICGAVKNILAIAAGIVDGLDLGMNALSALITRGLAEMQRLGIAAGGRSATFMGLAGVGDLILTCMGNLSRNRRFGAALAQGKTPEQAVQEIGQVVEGLDNLMGVYLLAKKLKVEMPITEQIYQVIHYDLPVARAITNLLSRKPKWEAEDL